MKVKQRMMMYLREDGMKMTNQGSLMMQIAMTTRMETTCSSECDPEVIGDPAPILCIFCIKVSDVARGEFCCSSDPLLGVESEEQQRRTEPV